MEILALILQSINLGGSIASIIGGINAALKRFTKSTAEDLFKKSLVKAVKENAKYLARFTETRNPETVRADCDMIDDVIGSLKETDLFVFTSLTAHESLAKITSLFSKCVIVPGHQYTPSDFERKIRPIVEWGIADFYQQLPFNQEAFNQIALEFIQENDTNQAELCRLYRAFLEKFDEIKFDVQERFTAIKNDTTEIKETTHANLGVSLETLGVVHEIRTQFSSASNSNINAIVADAVAKERLKEIHNARELLDNGKPCAALELLEKLKQRSWTEAAPNTKYRILTAIGEAKLALNKERQAAILLLEAFQYNSEDENALVNRALAHFLLGEHKKAADYAKKTLEKNEANTSAYTIVVAISEDEETLEKVISKVPEYLRETPLIAQAISEVARQRQDFEQAIKWGETSVSRAQDGVANYQAALARILIEGVLNNRPAVLSQQLNDFHKEQLKRAVELFTEAWNSVVNTEIRTVATDWVIWKCTALELLGEYSAAIEALNTAIQIEPDYSVLYMKRALLALNQEDYCRSIEFLEAIQTAPETPEAPILLAYILFVVERLEEAITELNDFLMSGPVAPLREQANRLLIEIYVACGDFDKAQEISDTMRESSPKNILFLVDAARIAKASGDNDRALSQFKEAFCYAQDSQDFQAIIALADELFNYREFEKAATLYEKIADTRLNSQWTMCLLQSYYHAGERQKTLKICQDLRDKYGPLEKVTAMEFLIYTEIGDMNQARSVGEMYVNAFPSDIEMRIRLGVILLRSNHFEELDRLLETPFDVKNLSLRAFFDLAYLYQVRSKPEKGLDIMYEARRRYYDNEEAHLKYLGAFLQVDKQIGELLDPTEVQSGTAVRLENTGQTSWYIIEKREDAHLDRKELNIDHALAQRLLGKAVSDKVCLQQNVISQQMGKIIEIKSKYVYAFQESSRTVTELFPDVSGFGVIKLNESPETDDSEKIRPILDFLDRQDETSHQMEEFHREHTSPIGTFMSCTGRDFLDMWSFLMNKPDLGIRCSVGNLDESIHAQNLLKGSVSKLIVDPISLLTIHGLGAADTVVKAFGRLGVAQSTIDELQHIINQREGMWSDREHMSIGKEGDRYVKSVFTPEQVRKDVEYLKGIVTWVRENCDILPCNAALEINYFSRQKLNDLFQAVFIDTLLIASEPGYLLLSDDERLRLYAKTDFSVGAGINLDVDGVWTQAVLKHCVNKKFLGKAEYNKMTIKLVCSHYYHTVFDAEVLMEAAEQSNWLPSEPYTTLVNTLGHQDAIPWSALDVAADFLYRLWTKPILPCAPDHLTLALLDGLTSGRRTQTVLKPLIKRLHPRLSLHPSAKQDILSLIEAYLWTRPI